MTTMGGLLNWVFSNCRGGAIQFFGTKRHHDKWLKDTENYLVKGCFAMSELGHGSNVWDCPNTASNVSIYNSVFNHIFILRCQVRGIETITTYDPKTQEFVINTPCESAQKYWIGGAANVRDILMIYFSCQILFSSSFFSITVFLLMKFMMQCHLLIVLIYGCNPFVACYTYYSFLSTIYKWM